MSNKYIYDVKSSSLYDSNGLFLKKVFCPKAQQWNQLIADDPLDRSRGCRECRHRVVNLDKATSLNWSSNEEPCVYIPAESTSVIFLHDSKELAAANSPKKHTEGLVLIKTARTVEDINRAANMGYWPDVRLIEYKDRESDEELFARFDQRDDINDLPSSWLAVGQNPSTGHIECSDRDWSLFSARSLLKEIIPTTGYYPNYQQLPIAAYLIPPNLPDGSEVIIEDPIEDLAGRARNRDEARFDPIKGHVKDRKVQIDYRSVKRHHVMG
jgi:hypothetical protein